MYFSELQYLLYPNILENGKEIIVSDIFKRVILRTEKIVDSSNYYEYMMKESDTLESISDSLYGSPYFYWIILFLNNLLDPKWNLPLNEKQFNRYIIEKYGSLRDAQNFSLPMEGSYSIVNNTCTITTNDTHNLLDGRKSFIYFSSNNLFNNLYEISYISNYSFSITLESSGNNQNGICKIHPPYIQYYMKNNENDPEFYKTDINTWELIVQDNRKFRRTLYDEEMLINQNKKIIKVLKPELLNDFLNSFRRELNGTTTGS